MTSLLKKLLAGYFKTLADGPKTGLLAAHAISTPDLVKKTAVATL